MLVYFIKRQRQHCLWQTVDRNHSLDMLVRTQVHTDCIFCLFEVKYLAPVILRVSAFSLLPVSTRHERIIPLHFCWLGLCFPFLYFYLCKPLSSQTNSEGKEDGFCVGSKQVGFAMPLPAVRAETDVREWGMFWILSQELSLGVLGRSFSVGNNHCPIWGAMLPISAPAAFLHTVPCPFQTGVDLRELVHRLLQWLRAWRKLGQ